MRPIGQTVSASRQRRKVSHCDHPAWGVSDIPISRLARSSGFDLKPNDHWDVQLADSHHRAPALSRVACPDMPAVRPEFRIQNSEFRIQNSEFRIRKLNHSHDTSGHTAVQLLALTRTTSWLDSPAGFRSPPAPPIMEGDFCSRCNPTGEHLLRARRIRIMSVAVTVAQPFQTNSRKTSLEGDGTGRFPSASQYLANHCRRVVSRHRR